MKVTIYWTHEGLKIRDKICEFFNIPEGLHPNALGYTAIAQAIAARLLEIDIFNEGGARELESRLGLAEGTIIVKPDLVEEVQ